MLFIGITEDYEIYQFENIEKDDKDIILKYLKKDNFYPLSQDAYNYCMTHSVYVLNQTDDLLNRMALYNNVKEDYINNIDNYVYISEEEYDDEGKTRTKEKQNNIIQDVILIEDCLVQEKVYVLSDVINNKIRKNKLLCGEMINFGITYNNKHYSYKLEDQINYEEKNKLILEGFINNETGVQIKADGELEYENVSVDYFNKLYKKLMYNKYYNLCYVTILNKYLLTLTDINYIERMTYEVYLPEEYQLELKELLKPYKQYRDMEEE